MVRLREAFAGRLALAGLVVCAMVCSGVAIAQDAAPSPADASRTKAKRAKANAGAPSTPGEAAAPAKDPAAALADYSRGVKAYQAGQFEPAVAALSSAIANGGLTPALLAKALYFRGAAYQKSNRSGLAIADLNSALYMKEGLDPPERADASALQTAAYKDAGLTAPAPVQPGSVASSSATAVGSSSGTTVAASGIEGLWSSMGNLFGGSTTPSPPAQAGAVQRIETTSTTSVATAPPDAAEVLPWANGSGAAAGSSSVTSSRSSAAPSRAAPLTAAVKPKKAGSFRVQVASVKSRDEASAIIGKLQGGGGVLASLPSAVDETTFGSAKFFRVRLGPFASLAEAKAPCPQLKSAGLDCLVTAK